MSEIALTNSSAGVVTDAECLTMCQALSVLLPAHCADWDAAVPSVAFYADKAKVPADAYHLDMLDQPPANADGAEAWHSDDGGHPDGLVFGGFLKQHGSAALSGPNSIFSAFCHEVFELLGDPSCTLEVAGDIQGVDGKPYTHMPAERCDRCQDLVYTVNVAGQVCTGSGWLLPAAYDPTATGPFDRSDKNRDGGPGVLSRWDGVTSGGYSEYTDAQDKKTTLFGKEMPAHLVELKTKYGRRDRAAMPCAKCAAKEAA